MSRTQCYEWFKRFKEGRISVGEDPRPGRRSTSANDDHVERVHVVICGSRSLTFREYVCSSNIHTSIIKLGFLTRLTFKQLT